MLPPYSGKHEIYKQIEESAYKIAQKLSVIGLINIQFAEKDGEIFVIEANPRCSRTMQFISKATGFPVIKVATKLMNGILLNDCKEFTQFQWKENIGKFYALRNLPHYAVKEAVFSFEKFANADIILGPEMKSTGEVIGISKNLHEAFAKAIIATKYSLPESGTVFVSLKNEDKTPKAVNIIQTLHSLGFNFYATEGTQIFLKQIGIEATIVKKLGEGSRMLLDLFSQKKINVIINTTAGLRSITDSFTIRKATVASRILHATTIESALMITNAI